MSIELHPLDKEDVSLSTPAETEHSAEVLQGFIRSIREWSGCPEGESLRQHLTHPEKIEHPWLGKSWGEKEYTFTVKSVTKDPWLLGQLLFLTCTRIRVGMVVELRYEVLSEAAVKQNIADLFS